MRACVYYQTAASENGSNGVQAWFHKSLGPEFLAVNVGDPRLMAVAAKLSKLSVFVTLIVGHAPTSVSDLEDRSNFFRQTGDLILRMRKAFPRSPVLLAIDANARVGSETCDNIGGAGAEKETESGQLFRIMLNRTSMCAVNTFWDAGWTWQSTRMTTSRIDFVCCDVACGDKVLDCRVVDEVDLTMDASVDRRMIMMTMHVDVCVKEQKRARREAAVNSMMLNDPSAKTAFQRDLWRFLKGQRPVDVDEHQLELTHFVREAALRRFGSARSAPMKPWISALTWSFLRLLAPVRRSFHAAFDEFSAAVKWLVALDRHEFVEREAYDAQIAHDNNEVRGCFAVVRALHGGKPRAHKTILKKNGENFQNEDQRKEKVAGTLG